MNRWLLGHWTTSCVEATGTRTGEQVFGYGGCGKSRTGGTSVSGCACPSSERRDGSTSTSCSESDPALATRRSCAVVARRDPVLNTFGDTPAGQDRLRDREGLAMSLICTLGSRMRASRITSFEELPRIGLSMVQTLPAAPSDATGQMPSERAAVPGEVHRSHHDTSARWIEACNPESPATTGGPWI